MSKARGLADLGNVYSDGALSNRNLIINGAMQVAQRGTSFTGLTNDTPKYTLDRWKFSEGGAPTGVLTITQDTDVPAGFGSSLKVDCTTANATMAGGALLKLAYRIEGQDLQQLGYGGAGAQQTTISFWVKSNKTGTYAIMVFQPDDNRQEQVQYTIDVADTWEKKTGIITADTTGVIDNDTGAGLVLTFALGAGTAWREGTAPTAWKSYLKADAFAGQTVNLSDNTANYFNVTGVQLEVGDTSTPFEHRSYAQEMALCQRYYEVDNPNTPTSFGGNITAQAYHVTNGAGNPLNRDGPFQPYKVDKRASATVTTYAYNGTTGAASPITNAGTDTNVQIKAGTSGFQLSSSTYRALHVWFAWAADAEL
jgi:hypothetical protein